MRWNTLQRTTIHCSIRKIEIHIKPMIDVHTTFPILIDISKSEGNPVPNPIFEICGKRELLVLPFEYRTSTEQIHLVT